MRVLTVKNFDRFQHYHDRLPPWIKLYNALLDDYEFIKLSDAARCHLMLIWLLASRHENRIPLDPKYIAEALHTRTKIDFDTLVQAGFLVIADADDAEVAQSASRVASTPSAEVVQSAKPRALARGRGRGKTKTEKNSAAKKPAAGSTGGAKPKRDTWITPFATAWEDLYGGKMAIDPNLRPLKSAVEKLGAEEALRRWEIYLDQTQPKFASGARFSATLNEWEAPRSNGTKPTLTSGVAVTPESLARAATLFALGREFDLLSFDGDKAEYAAAKNRAAKDARAGATWDDDLKASRLWEGLTDLPHGMAIKEIARRLELARTQVRMPERAAS